MLLEFVIASRVYWCGFIMFSNMQLTFSLFTSICGLVPIILLSQKCLLNFHHHLGKLVQKIFPNYQQFTIYQHHGLHGSVDKNVISFLDIQQHLLIVTSILRKLVDFAHLLGLFGLVCNMLIYCQHSDQLTTILNLYLTLRSN